MDSQGRVVNTWADILNRANLGFAGYKFLEANQLKIGKRIFKFWKSREIEGKIKTITIKRNPLGELFVFVVTDQIVWV
jgi:hypothetical protein